MWVSYPYHFYISVTENLILHSVFSYMSSSLLIPVNFLTILDDYRVDSLYKVYRFCYIRLSPKDLPKKKLRPTPKNLVIEVYNIDLRKEIIDLHKPNVFCCCRSRLSVLNILTYKQSNTISRLKVQLDAGKQFLKLSVNIILFFRIICI